MTSPVLTVDAAARLLSAGHVIAYPTEAVYGLGCDPENEKAVRKLLALKKRKASQGLILISDEFHRLERFVTLPDEKSLDRVMQTWPGPITWIFPRSGTTPPWISGDHDSVAVRLTAHPLCRELCRAYGGAIVSTSANVSAKPSALSPAEVDAFFEGQISGIVAGDLGGMDRPSEIRDVRTGQVLRSG